MRQFRGCSRLYYALETEGTDGAVTFGTPKILAPVKTVSRDIEDANEEVWADNVLQDTTHAGSKITRSFDVTRIAAEVENELLGNTEVAVGSNKGYATKPDASKRPYIAIGYALHDGDVDNPCEIVWAYHCKVNSISKAANTIDGGTSSEGQTIEIVNAAPKKPFTTTKERNLDFSMPVVEGVDVDKFFAQVVTPDNAATVMKAS